MQEPSQRQFDEDIHHSMDLFKRAQVGEVGALTPVQPTRVFVALDGSTQDQAVAALVQRLRDQHSVIVGYIDLTLDGTSPATLEGKKFERTDGEAFDKVLSCAAEFAADLLVFPCPFGRDFDSVGADSAGTIVDVLAARSKIPFIAVRRTDPAPAQSVEHIRLIFTGENEAAHLTARWATGLLAKGGLLEMLLLVEEEFYENFRETMQSIEPDREVRYSDLKDALAKIYAPLHAALQHTSLDQGFRYRLHVQHEGALKELTPADPETYAVMMALGLNRGHHDSVSEVHDFVRRSPHPVLVVSVE